MANPKWGDNALGTEAYATPDTTVDSAQSVVYTPDGFAYNVNSQVGKKYDVGINGVGFMLKNTELGRYIKESQKTFVERQESGDRSEQSFDNWWPRVFTDFIKGEGQKRLTPDGNAAKFWRSKGIDISVKGEFSLLFDTAQSLAVANDVVPLCVANGYLYTANAAADTARFSSNPDAASPTWSSVDTAADLCGGAGTEFVNDVVADGTRVFACFNAAGVGISMGTAGSTTKWASYGTAIANKEFKKLAVARVDTTSYLLALAKDTSANTYHLYWFALSGAGAGTDIAPTTAGWVAEDLTFGDGNAYFIQHNNADKAWIMKWNGTNTTLFESLRPGFIPKSIEYEGDNLYVGGSYDSSSTQGEGRVYAIPTAGGSPSLVCILDTSVASTRKFDINALLIRDKNLYIAYNHHTGLARYDLDEASLSKDVYSAISASDNNVVQNIVWFLNKPFFSVKQSGVYGRAATYVANGTYEFSIFDYNTAARKYIISAEIEHEALTAGESIELQLSTDDGSTNTSVITNSTDGSTKTTVHFTELKANTFAGKVIISSGANNTTAPVIKSIRFLGAPYIEGKYVWTLPILITQNQKTNDRHKQNDYSAYGIWNSLESIKNANSVVNYQDVTYSDAANPHYVIIEHLKTILTETKKGKQEGVCLVTAREVRVA